MGNRVLGEKAVQTFPAYSSSHMPHWEWRSSLPLPQTNPSQAGNMSELSWEVDTGGPRGSGAGGDQEAASGS